MTLQFASLGSGSKGNATVVKSDNTLLMVDCGFTIKETERRLNLLGHSPDEIDAIVVTHEHSDHIKGVGPLARKYQLPVYLTHGTGQYDGLTKIKAIHEINIHRNFSIAGIEVTPVPVPHDAREPCQFLFRNKKKTFGILTDLGSITPHVTEQYQQCDALMLESNHCPNMLALGPYPMSLKQRVGGNWGHLSNFQAATLLENIEQQHLQHLVISHISEKNNTEALARQSIEKVFTRHDALVFADQNNGVSWLNVF